MGKQTQAKHKQKSISKSQKTQNRKQSNASSVTYSQNSTTHTNEDTDKGNFKDLNTNMAYVLTKKYNPFKERLSILDDYTQGSMANRTILKGFYNLTMVFGLITISTYPILRYQKKGQFFNDNLLSNFSDDFWFCALTWPMFYAWSYTAYLVQKLIVKGMSQTLGFILQCFIISFLFIYCMYMVFENTWCTSHSGYISMLACTHSMKMHSYYIINKEYRKDTLNSIKNGESPISPYPQNITIKDFTLYMWMPVLVYEYEYPRNKTFRLKFLIWKIVQTVCGIIIAYVIVSDFMMPQIEKGDTINILELLCRLILPCCAFFLNTFFMIWEGICNIFAEITRYSDRRFYDDWWNATTFEEFNRKWNRSVYNFLFRHVYLECIYRYKVSKKTSQLITFFISAIMHEYILILVFKIARPIMTLFILQQIPLFYITKSMFGNRSGNLLVWWGLLLGNPLIGVCYLRCEKSVTEWYYRQQMI